MYFYNEINSLLNYKTKDIGKRKYEKIRFVNKKPRFYSNKLNSFYIIIIRNKNNMKILYFLNIQYDIVI